MNAEQLILNGVNRIKEMGRINTEDFRDIIEQLKKHGYGFCDAQNQIIDTYLHHSQIDDIVQNVDIMETDYSDGSVWVEFKVNDNYSYLYSENYNDTDEDLVMMDLYNGKIDINDIVSKPKLSVCSPELAWLIERCHQSQNDMFYLEYEDLEDLEDFSMNLEELENEADRLGISEYFLFGGFDSAVAVFGGIITKFLF